MAAEPNLDNERVSPEELQAILLIFESYQPRHKDKRKLNAEKNLLKKAIVIITYFIESRLDELNYDHIIQRLFPDPERRSQADKIYGNTKTFINQVLRENEIDVKLKTKKKRPSSDIRHSRIHQVQRDPVSGLAISSTTEHFARNNS